MKTSNNVDFFPIERLYSVEQSSHIADIFFEQLEITPKISLLSANEFFISCSECNLYDSKSQEHLATGFGKGNKTNSLLGAKYEAIECYTSISSNFDIPHYYKSCFDLEKEGAQLVQSRIPLQIYRESNYRNQPLSWLKYVNYFYPSDCVFIPAASITPLYLHNPYKDDKFPYKEVYMQCTNNGIAVGCSFSEALIHSVSEIIERDAMSFFLLNNFIIGTDKPISIIDTITLSGKCKKAYDDLCIASGAIPIISVMPNDFEVSSFCTSIAYKDFILPIKGFGTSLNTENAVYRSICECFEQLILYKKILYQESVNSIDAFKDIPKFKKCLYFDLDAIFKCTEPKKLSFKKLKNTPPKNIDHYLEALLSSVKKANASLYYKILFDKYGVHTVHAVIPEAEEIFSLLKGVVPLFNAKITKCLTEGKPYDF